MSLTDEILNGRIENVFQQLEAGAKLNELDMYGFTPLTEAVIANRLDISQLLISRGADVKAKDLTGSTALYWAVENSNAELCKLLLNHGADPNAYTKYSQPILMQPLLRRQQDLKELLYHHGADLKFAQDYINTKLIGHRFELIGRVDVVDHHNTFIEMDYEGFILEFTIGIIHDSLTQFINNFAARNLRSHFRELQAIIGAFAAAAELIKYQQHLIDIRQHQHRLTRLVERDLLILPVGYQGHAITFIKCGPLFAKCDRGEQSLRNPSVMIFKIGNPAAFNAAFIKRLLYQKQDQHFVTEGIINILGLQPLTHLPLPSQLIGNCSWANVEATVPALLLMQWLRSNLAFKAADIRHHQQAALAIYKQWQEWDKDWALHQCVESFYDASPARKASKAALLAAVLFQTCRYTVAQDLGRANKILAVLATPSYEYVLNNYIKVYKGTDAGRNLVELIDLYSK